MTRLAEFLQEKNGNFSSTRLAFLLWVLGTLFVWIFISIKNLTLQPLPESVIIIIGILMTGKVTQKFGEKDFIPSKSNPTPPTEGQE
ncbi:MAG: hypothetical protein D6748_07535 [Calditrichaeota bacterium]|nr:MAG: hypothetical protein D6748_07535 [Calditrichota bacterium]